MSRRYHSWHPPTTTALPTLPSVTKAPVQAANTGDFPAYLPACEHSGNVVDGRGLRLSPIARAIVDCLTRVVSRPPGAEPPTSAVGSEQQVRPQVDEYDDWVDASDQGESCTCDSNVDVEQQRRPQYDDYEERTVGEIGSELDRSDSIESPAAIEVARSKLLSRAIAVLTAERQRSGEPLRQESIERVYAQLKLTPDEMLRVGHEARLIGLMDSEEPGELDELSDNPDDDEGQEVRNRLLDRILGHDLLSADRERQLGRAIQVAKKLEAQVLANEIPAGDDLNREIVRGRQARQALVLANARLAMDVARRYAHGGLESDDLLQEGVIGLLRAAESYDPDLGFRFTTYATWWIRQSILRAVANTGRPIRLPVHRVDQLNALRRTTRRLQAKNPQGRITPKQIADELGWSIETVGKLLVIEAESFTSLHPADDDGPSVLDQLVSPDPTPEDATIAFDFQAFIADCLAALPERDADVLRLRFGLHGKLPHTLEDIGKMYKVTRERIRQIESKGLRELRRPSGKMIEHGREFLDE